MRLLSKGILVLYMCIHAFDLISACTIIESPEICTM